MKQKNQKTGEEEEVKVGFVDGLFEMYKLRCDIAKARAELLADSAMSTYNHKFGTFIFGNHIDYRSSWIESLIEPKRLELDRTIFDKFITPKLIRRRSQYAIVALTRSGQFQLTKKFFWLLCSEKMAGSKARNCD